MCGERRAAQCVGSAHLQGLELVLHSPRRATSVDGRTATARARRASLLPRPYYNSRAVAPPCCVPHAYTDSNRRPPGAAWISWKLQVTSYKLQVASYKLKLLCVARSRGG